MQSNSIKYTDKVMQPSPLSISRTYLSSKLKLYPGSTNLPLPSPSGDHITLSVAMNLTALDISFKRHPLVFVLLHFANFT